MSFSRTQTVNSLIATTWAKSTRETVQQVFKITPFLSYIAAKKAVMPRGYELRFPIITAENPNGTWFGLDGTVSTGDVDPAVYAAYTWAYYAIPVKSLFIEQHKNAGNAQIADLIKLKIEDTRESISKEMERVLLGDGSGDNEPNGLQKLIHTDPTGTTLTIGLHEQTANSWWQNHVYAIQGAARDYLRKDLRHLWRLCTEYGYAPEVLVTDGSVYELFEDVVDDRQTYSKLMSDLGFPDTVTFKTKPVIWSPQAQTGGYVRMFNNNDMKVYYDPANWFKLGEFKEAQNNLNKVAHIICVMQYVTRRRRCAGVLTGVTS